MAKVIYEYFKKEMDEGKILVRIDPETFDGLELIVSNEGNILKTTRQFDETIYEDLEEDEFKTGQAMEFNLYLKGVG